jgi:hypothetical protein
MDGIVSGSGRFLSATTRAAELCLDYSTDEQADSDNRGGHWTYLMEKGRQAEPIVRNFAVSRPLKSADQRSGSQRKGEPKWAGVSCCGFSGCRSPSSSCSRFSGAKGAGPWLLRQILLSPPEHRQRRQ